jgi:hypothetical protein
VNVKLSAAVKNTYMRGLVRLAKWFDSIGLRISSVLEADLHRSCRRLKGRLFSTTGAAAFESRETTQGGTFLIMSEYLCIRSLMSYRVA